MKIAASKTKRASATVALAGALLATTGCGYIYTQPTTLIYDASDGVSFTMWPKGERVDMRNMMIISGGEGQPGRVLGTVYNLGKENQTVTFDMGGESFKLTIPAGEHIILDDDANEVIVADVPVQPGEMIMDAKGVIGEVTEEFNMPVLDGTLEEYKRYLPNAASASADEAASASMESVPNSTADAAVAPSTANPASTAIPSATSSR